MKSVMTHQFSQIPRAEIPRSVFDRSHGHKTTFDVDWLIPILADEALPGDTFHLKAHLMARLSTPIFPIMDNLYLDTFYFAVPNRLLWDHWQNFCGERADPDDETEYLMPQIESPAGGFGEGTLMDYFGLPVSGDLAGTNTIKVNALFSRAYNLIWNEWFRPQDVCEKVRVDKGDADDNISYYQLLLRAKRHDYFTSCLPWPQKGPDVSMPLGTTAPVIGTGKALGFSDGYNHKFGLFINDDGSSYTIKATDSIYGENVGTGIGARGTITNSKAIGIVSGSTDISGLQADLSVATAATINSVREAFQLQKMLERDARGGTRYTEILRSHFSVVSPDARLQRPEYLGGSSVRINVNPVQQTAPYASGDHQKLGSLGAFGIVSDSNGGFSKSFVEHCVIIGLANVRSDLTYQQGVERMWWRQTRYDHYWPSLAHLGEQAVLTREIFCDGSAEDDTVFGYQERYAEYRYKLSKITGKFRNSATGSLSAWHLSQYFNTAPACTDPEFILQGTPMSRVVAVTTEPHIIFDSFFEMKCARPMPVYSVPGLVDHF